MRALRSKHERKFQQGTETEEEEEPNPAYRRALLAQFPIPT